MNQYIEKDKVLSLLGLDHNDYVYIDKRELAKRIEKLRGIDIVRCKKCKFSEVWESTAGNELYCEKQRVCPYDWGALTAFYVKADDYCSYGERKEGE